MANNVNVNSLCYTQEDSARVLNREWLVVVGVCIHLGCVPLPNVGNYGEKESHLSSLVLIFLSVQWTL